MDLLVLGVGLDAADVMRLHLVQGIHQLLQLLFEAAADTAELVPLPYFASPPLQCVLVVISLYRRGTPIKILGPHVLLVAASRWCKAVRHWTHAIEYLPWAESSIVTACAQHAPFHFWAGQKLS